MSTGNDRVDELVDAICSASPYAAPLLDEVIRERPGPELRRFTFGQDGEPLALWSGRIRRLPPDTVVFVQNGLIVGAVCGLGVNADAPDSGAPDTSPRGPMHPVADGQARREHTGDLRPSRGVGSEAVPSPASPETSTVLAQFDRDLKSLREDLGRLAVRLTSVGDRCFGRDDPGGRAVGETEDKPSGVVQSIAQSLGGLFAQVEYLHTQASRLERLG